MKYRQLSNWVDPARCHGLVYFAQLLDEMLFEYSLDTYKPSVLHTGLLASEALGVVEEIERGSLRPATLPHITAELCANLEKDSVAKALVALPPASFYPALKNPKTPIREVETVLGVLNVQLSPAKYREKNEELLIREVTGNQSRLEIRRLARSYVTSLVASGISQASIRDELVKFFYSAGTSIASTQAIKAFIDIFPRDNTDFCVVFRVDRVFMQFAKALASLGINVAREPPKELDSGELAAIAQEKDGRVFAVFGKIPAKDVQSARTSAEAGLKLGATLIGLFHHKENPGWSLQCMVVNKKTNQYKRIPRPMNAMHKSGDLLQHVAHKRLKLFLSDFSMERESFFKFIRSSQLHSMALASNTEENQLLNLWISIESLVPSETKDEHSATIEHISSSMVPFLNINYVERLINNLVKDLLLWNAQHVRAVFKGIDGQKFTDKLANLLALKELESERNALEAKLEHFYLLRDRFQYFADLLETPRKTLSALDAHRIRVEWQIRRIYRTRNVIVHTGRTPSFTRTLIEHAHDYLDAVLSLLSKLASKPKAIHSVAQGFKYVDISYATYVDALSKKGLTYDARNLTSLIFPRP